MPAPVDHPVLDLDLPAPTPPTPRPARPRAAPAAAGPGRVLGGTDADTWWHGLSPDRREQIRRWITQRTTHHDHVEGQLDALDALATTEEDR